MPAPRKALVIVQSCRWTAALSIRRWSIAQLSKVTRAPETWTFWWIDERHGVNGTNVAPNDSPTTCAVWPVGR
jgi:hypothetical protein